MAKLNENFLQIKESYLFSEVARRVAAYAGAHPKADVIRLGIGDVTLPLAPAVVEAMHRAADEMGDAATFRGYGPEQGYDFLRDAIRTYYKDFGVTLDADEIFVSDGAKSDLGNITGLFSADNTVLIPDPVYPVYVDTNLMDGRKIVYLPATAENGFLPMPPDFGADIIYLCSPNNPTGAVYSRAQLRQWVEYANRCHAVILFDAAYEVFVNRPELPHSIFEVEGARTCAIEFCSFSKKAGFTGTRCGYTVVPKNLVFGSLSMNKMWNRRQTTKTNGVAYVIQRAAAAVFTPEAREQVQSAVQYYRENARCISSTLDELGMSYMGGVCSPYIWLKCPAGMDSWKFFDYLLEKIHVVGTPGCGFGECGEGYFRLTAFGSRERTAEAMERFRKLFAK